MIAHRLKTVRGADQIMVVDQGRVVQKGTHDELIRQAGIYRDFVSERTESSRWTLLAYSKIENAVQDQNVRTAFLIAECSLIGYTGRAFLK